MAWRAGRGKARPGRARRGKAGAARRGKKIAVAAFSSQWNPMIASVAATAALLARVGEVHRLRFVEAVRGDARAGGRRSTQPPAGNRRLSGVLGRSFTRGV